MFDIGFTELLLIAVVALLVIGPEKLPGAIRTGSVWVGRLKRSYQDIKREVELEIHNSEVLEKLHRAEAEIKEQINPGIESLIEPTAGAAYTPTSSENPARHQAEATPAPSSESPVKPSVEPAQTRGNESDRNE